MPQTWEEEDSLTTPHDKNHQLAILLLTIWDDLPVIRIERMPTAGDNPQHTGWRIVY